MKNKPLFNGISHILKYNQLSNEYFSRFIRIFRWRNWRWNNKYLLKKNRKKSYMRPAWFAMEWNALFLLASKTSGSSNSRIVPKSRTTKSLCLKSKILDKTVKYCQVEVGQRIFISYILDEIWEQILEEKNSGKKVSFITFINF